MLRHRAMRQRAREAWSSYVDPRAVGSKLVDWLVGRGLFGLDLGLTWRLTWGVCQVNTKSTALMPTVCVDLALTWYNPQVNTKSTSLMPICMC